jgi:hypothetical protein
MRKEYQSNRNSLFNGHFRVVLVFILIFGIIFTTTEGLFNTAVYAAEAGTEEGTTQASPYTADETGFVNYSGDVDTVTGEPITSRNSGGVEKNANTLKDGSTYDKNSNKFLYTVPGGVFACSVCDGMIVTGSVSFAVSDKDLKVAVYWNGNKLNGIPGSVSDEGNYVVLAWDNVSESQVLTFQIVDKVTGRISQYIIPNGFTIRSVRMNGVDTRVGFGSVDMSEEAYYEIEYRCNATGIDYYLNVTTDHTPPNVSFVGLDENNKAQGPVTLKGLAKDDRVYVTFNDEKGSLDSNNQVTQSGKYHIVVMDAAGNSVTRDFIILLYLNVKGVVFLAILVVCLIGVIIALYISRKRLRVR